MSFGEWTFEGGAKGRSRVATDGGGRYTARYFLIPIKEAYALKRVAPRKNVIRPERNFLCARVFILPLRSKTVKNKKALFVLPGKRWRSHTGF